MQTTPPIKRKAMSTERALVSLGRAAAILQAMPHRVTYAAQALSIEPAMKLNEITYYAESDVERIGDHLRDNGAKQ